MVKKLGEASATLAPRSRQQAKATWDRRYHSLPTLETRQAVDKIIVAQYLMVLIYKASLYMNLGTK